MPYIRNVHVEAPATRNEHITEVQHSPTATGNLTPASRASVAREIDAGTRYVTHNDRTGAEALVETRTSTAGVRYITTLTDGIESNNLLDLPRY
jgi:hypothetical protein